MVKLASISIDLDEVPRYAAIHGVEVPAGRGSPCRVRRNACHDSRAGSMTSRFEPPSLPSAKTSSTRRTVTPSPGFTLQGTKSEITRITTTTTSRVAPQETSAKRFNRAATIIEQSCGKRPVGFRAPGYRVSDVLFSALEATGVEYDSSVFPCASYYALKAAALAAIKLRGRKSSSILDRPAVLRAPREPYRVGRPYLDEGATA